MIFTHNLSEELQVFRGETPDSHIPICLSGGDGSRLELYVSVVDQLGCAVNQLRLTTSAHAGANRATLEAWAEGIAQRVGYLLEPLTPLEYDIEPPQALLRSLPPSPSPEGTRYYEARLEATSETTTLTLERYLSPRGAEREAISMQLTYETLQKLMNDLAESLPVNA